MRADKNARKRKHDGDVAASDGKLRDKDYEQALARLHVELVKLQQWVVYKGVRVCILFEGRDGAGKGGTIKAITERFNPEFFASSRCRRRPSAKSRSCIFSGTFPTCLRPERS